MSEQQSIGAVMANMTARCTSCGACVRPCAFLQQQGTPATIAERGTTPDNLLSAYGCSLCGLCDSICPEGLAPSELFRSMRRAAIRQGVVNLKPYAPWLNYERFGRSILFRRDLIPPECTSVFFPGCSLPGIRPQAVHGLYRLLQQQEPSIGLVLDCCGKISHDLGLADRFQQIFKGLIDRLQSRGITRILTACPGCSKIFRNYGSPLEVLSVYELLASRNLPQAAGPWSPNPVVIHDPCPTRSDHQQQQAVRSLVTSCGYLIEELSSTGDRTRCCGQGGMVEGCVPGTVQRAAAQIGIETAGRQVVTYCASCCDTLGEQTPTTHIADLLTGTDGLTTSPVPSLKRWLNRLILRFTSL